MKPDLSLLETALQLILSHRDTHPRIMESFKISNYIPGDSEHFYAKRFYPALYRLIIAFTLGNLEKIQNCLNDIEKIKNALPKFHNFSLNPISILELRLTLFNYLRPNLESPHIMKIVNNLTFEELSLLDENIDFMSIIQTSIISANLPISDKLARLLVNNPNWEYKLNAEHEIKIQGFDIYNAILDQAIKLPLKFIDFANKITDFIYQQENFRDYYETICKVISIKFNHTLPLTFIPNSFLENPRCTDFLDEHIDINFLLFKTLDYSLTAHEIQLIKQALALKIGQEVDAGFYSAIFNQPSLLNQILNIYPLLINILDLEMLPKEIIDFLYDHPVSSTLPIEKILFLIEQAQKQEIPLLLAMPIILDPGAGPTQLEFINKKTLTGTDQYDCGSKEKQLEQIKYIYARCPAHGKALLLCAPTIRYITTVMENHAFFLYALNQIPALELAGAFKLNTGACTSILKDLKDIDTIMLMLDYTNHCHALALIENNRLQLHLPKVSLTKDTLSNLFVFMTRNNQLLNGFYLNLSHCGGIENFIPYLKLSREKLPAGLHFELSGIFFNPAQIREIRTILSELPENSPVSINFDKNLHQPSVSTNRFSLTFGGAKSGPSSKSARKSEGPK